MKKETGALYGHKSKIISIQSMDTLVISVDQQNKVCLWNTNTLSLIFEISTQSELVGAYFLDANHILLVGKNRIERYNILSRKKVSSLDVLVQCSLQKGFTCIILENSGLLQKVELSDDKIDLHTIAEVRLSKNRISKISTISMADSNTLICGGRSIFCYKLDKSKVIGRNSFNTPYTPSLRHFDHYDNKLFGLTSDGRIHVWEMSNYRLLGSTSYHNNEPTCIVIDTVDKLIVSGDRNQKLILQRFADLKLDGTLSGFANSINCLVEDNDNLFFIDKSGSLKMWNLKSPLQLTATTYKQLSKRQVKEIAISSDTSISVFVSTNNNPHKNLVYVINKNNYQITSIFKNVDAAYQSNDSTLLYIKRGRLIAYNWLSHKTRSYLLEKFAPSISYSMPTPHIVLQHYLISSKREQKRGTAVYETKIMNLLDNKAKKFNNKIDFFLPIDTNLIILHHDSIYEIWKDNYSDMRYSFIGYLPFKKITDSLYLTATRFGNVTSGIQWVFPHKTNLYENTIRENLFNSDISSIVVDSQRDKLYVASQDGSIKILNVWPNDSIPLTLTPVFKTDLLLSTGAGYYFSTKNSVRNLTFRKNGKYYGFEQFDLFYNRPDKVIRNLVSNNNSLDTTLINLYYHAWQKRINKLSIDSNTFLDNTEISIPHCEITNRDQIKYEQTKNTVTIVFSAMEKATQIVKYNVWVNDVPIFGTKGIDCSFREAKGIVDTALIILAQGENKIEVSVLNARGIESYRVPLYVRYTPKETPVEKLYFVGIGIDKYREPGHNLQYSAKDIRDLATKLKEQYGNDIEIDTLLDENVNIKNIKALKQRLLQSTVNDKVIVAFSGHGLLSADLDYFLSTHTVDFKNPQINGLPYDDLEWLLDSIPARKKLLLIDACHSGELDKESIRIVNKAIDSLSTASKSNKGVYVENTETTARLGLKNSFELMQELFANVNRGTGATVIAASGGTQFAQEQGALKNGVFTYSILELMRQKKDVKVSELKNTVGKRVEELTNGNQKPTSRSENIEFDWNVW